MPIDLPVEIEMMTPEEAQEVFHTNARRANNFAKFVGVMNQRDIGDGWSIWINRVAVENGLDADEYAKQSKYNWNEAAGKRVKRTTIDAELVGTDDKERTIRTDTGDVLTNYDAATHMYDMPAPVKLTWKTVAHTEQREVTDDHGRKGVATVTVIDRYQVVVKASIVQHRATRVPRQVVDTLVKEQFTTVSTNVGDTLALADGRTAKLGKNGKWYAPKLTPAPSANGSTTTPTTSVSELPSDHANGTSSNGSDGTASSSETTPTTPESASEPTLASARRGQHK